MEETNYKGVMLCARTASSAPQAQAPPPTNSMRSYSRPKPASTLSFVPGGSTPEALGLNPPKDNHMISVVAAHKRAALRRANQPPKRATFMVKHRKWLAEQGRMRAQLSAEQAAAATIAAAARARFAATMRTKRQHVRGEAPPSLEPAATAPVPSEPAPERTASVAAPAPAPEADPLPSLPPPPPSPPPALVTAAAPPPSPSPAPVTAAAPSPPPGAVDASSSAVSKSVARALPKWALTEEAADELEDDEAAGLVSFAESLDFEKYVDDIEVREALSVIRERVDAQNRQAEAEALVEPDDSVSAAGDGGRDDEDTGEDWYSDFVAQWNGADRRQVAASETSTVRRRLGGKRATDAAATREWDSSSRVGDDPARTTLAATADTLDEAKELMEMNPALKATHSLRSLAAAIETASEKAPSEAGGARATLKETVDAGNSFAPRGSLMTLPPLKLVTIHERGTGEVSASNLPYLHRNPAV